MSEPVVGAIVVGLLGLGWTVAGFLAWTGRWRGWIRHGRGYRWLMGVLSGPGLALLALGGLLDSLGVDGALGPLGVTGLLLSTLGFAYMLATIFVTDRFYPPWYRRLPESERNW